MKMILNNKRGITLVVVLMIMMLLLSLTGAGLLTSGVDLKTAASFKTGTNVLQAADAGIQHALAVIPSGTTFGYTSSTTVASNSSFATYYSYTVTAINDPQGLVATRAILTSTATGPNSTQKVITAYVSRGSGGSCTICMPGTFDEAEVEFGGNSFTIGGFDTALGSTACATSGSSVPAIGATDQNLVTEITNALDSNQRNQVIGSGANPSVAVVPAMSQSVSQIADAYIALIPPSCTGCVLSGGNITGGTLGTDASPQITRITGDVTLAGTVTGSGVLIVEGDVTIQGNVTFNGLIVARGEVEVQLAGQATVLGGIMIGGVGPGVDIEIELEVKGNAKVCYSSQGLAKADAAGPNVLPKPAKLVAWQEKLN
jgi:Tfp pilus assembly protein PilX